MKVLFSLVVFVVCSQSADAGIVNWFYTPPEVTMHNRELKARSQAHKRELTYERKAYKSAVRHAERSGVFQMPPQAVRRSFQTPVRTMRQQTIIIRSW